MSDLAIGIMSGTSGDGVDAALVAVDDAGRVTDTIAHRHMLFSAEVRERVIAVGAAERLSAADLARLHGALGDAYAEAALALASIAPRRPSVIGVHGQTVAHLPDERVTFQIGDAARVAVRTGIPTVSDFRSADIAEGGQGAPLTPFADHVLFAGGAPRVVVNIGGIANVTLMPDADRDHVTGFDTGPGNMVMDAIARRTGAPFDRDGLGARRGRVLDLALRNALAHPFLAKPAPKSTGREEFGEAFANKLDRDIRGERGSVDDALATATELTARTIADAINEATPPKVRWNDVLVAGGGAQNPSLMDRLTRVLAPIPVRWTDEAGIPREAREAVAFAILAVYRLRGLPNTLPRVTGARRAVSAGGIHSP
jgi:anhydro-N-acetylmuramic acid kinase